ncbi:PAS domain S-box protein [Patescibacteria group bacterium]
MFGLKSKGKLVKYETIFNATMDGLLILDFDRKIVDINSSALSILGYQKEELLGRDVLDLHTDDYEDACTKNHLKAMSGERACCDCPYLKSDGELIFSDSVLNKIVVDDKEFILISFHDISAQKELEARLHDEVTKLEKINELLTGREERIISLKDELKEIRSGSCDR